jgi:flagellar hook-associated protein 1 FlgK
MSVSEASEFPGSGKIAVYFNRPGASPLELNESMLGGGEVTGLLRFANNDLAEGRNLLGRMAQAIGMSMNEQNKLGLTLDGQFGKDLFAVPTSAPGYSSGAGVGSVAFSSPTQFAASDYEVRFTTPPAGQVVRLSDGKATAFTDLTDLASQQIDGLTFNVTTAGNAGERILFKPFANTAANVQALVNAPSELAAANPINAAMGTANAGSLQLAGLKATGQPNPPGLVLPPNGDTATPPAFPGGIQLQFNAGPPATYDVLDRGSNPPTTLATAQPYVSGQPIDFNGWQITLQGTPKTGDTVNIGNALDPQYGDAYKRNAGNAGALMNLRDAQMFDNATLQDGWASAMSQVGTRTQSAQYAANMSTSIADSLESQRVAVSGVNLDEEAAKLIQYQQAYQASAKMLQIAQSIFDSLLQTVSR